MGVISSLFGKRKDSMEIATSIASAIDECLRLGGLTLLESSIIVLGKNDSVTITNSQNLLEVKADVRSTGEVYINKLPEFDRLKNLYKFTFPPTGVKSSPQEAELLANQRHRLVDELAWGALRGLR